MPLVRLSLPLFVLGCFSFAAHAADPSPPGVVFVVGGVGGLDPLQAAPLVLPMAGVRHEMRVVEWTHGKCRFLRDLQDRPHLLAHSESLAEEIRELKAAEPSRPIFLIGHSAGAGLVLAAAEKLPPATLERVILLSAAVSPTFDLRDALRATRCEIVSYHSSFDCLVLGCGTGLFGTVDRVYGPAAGRDGFELPDNLDEEGQRLYRRLVQVPWRLRYLLRLQGGGHNSTSMPLFLARQVAPWLRP
jgi:pimeloyl-ACP methyl ester carboxylesterase